MKASKQRQRDTVYLGSYYACSWSLQMKVSLLSFPLLKLAHRLAVTKQRHRIHGHKTQTSGKYSFLTPSIIQFSYIFLPYISISINDNNLDPLPDDHNDISTKFFSDQIAFKTVLADSGYNDLKSNLYSYL